MKFTKKIVDSVGAEDVVESINTKYLHDLIALDVHHFSAILPYRYFWEEKNLFINEHSLGFGLELSVLCGADEKTVKNISDLLRYKLRDHYDLQFILWGSNKVGEIIDDAYKIHLQQDNIYAKLAKVSMQYYKQGAAYGLENKLKVPVFLREYRLFAFISKNTAYSEGAVFDLISLRDDLLAEFNSADIACAFLKLKPFLQILRAWVNPNNYDIYPHAEYHEEQTTLNEQIVDKSFELIHEVERIQINITSKENEETNTCITNLSLRNLPECFALWMSADNFFNIFRSSQAIRCPFLISVHVRLIPQMEAKNRAQSRYLSMHKKAQTIYAKYISGTQETAAEWKKIRDELDTDQIRLAECYFNLLLFSNKNEEKNDEASAIACFRYNGIELFNTKYMQLQSYLATLPFVISEGMFHDLKIAGRTRTLTTWNLANLLPLIADYKLCRRGVLLTTFRNQISFFDMYNELLPIANYNIAVAATSGAGKSFLVQAILTYVLSISGKCFVIDLGQSYRKLCETVNGVYLEYTSLKLNPFSNIDDIQESSEQIRDLLAVLASPSSELQDVEEEYLHESVIKAWEMQGNQANIDTIILALKNLNAKHKDKRIDDLITLLNRYSTKGTYPEIFNTHSVISKNSHFIVLELGELENKPALMKAVLFALMLNIEKEMYHSPRNQPKMVVIDEAWRLLAGDNKAAARFIEKGYRTARRHFGSFVTITQGIEDFLKSDEAQACWNCSDIKITMLQNAKAFENFMFNHKNYFDPYVENLIKHFKEAKSNGFSEFMLQLGKIQSFHRLVVDPFSRVMFSSTGKEFEAVKKYREQGFSMEESILKVSEETYALNLF